MDCIICGKLLVGKQKICCSRICTNRYLSLYPNSGTFKKGRIPHNSGKKVSEELRKKLSNSHKGIIYGPMSPQTKDKIADSNRKSWADPEIGIKRRDSVKGNRFTQKALENSNIAKRRRKGVPNPRLSKVLKDKYISGQIIPHNLGKPREEWEKEKISIGMANAMIDGRSNPTRNSYGKSGHFYSYKNQKRIFYRSSYELKAFEILENDQEILSYKYKAIRIPYINKNGHKRNTIPDLLAMLYGNRIRIIEVKPIFKLQESMLKINAVKEYCLSNNLMFEIWAEKELGIP